MKRLSTKEYPAITFEEVKYMHGIEILNKKGMETPDIQGVLFDMDGVILDTEKLYTRFWQEAAHTLGYPMTKEQALGMRSLSRAIGKSRIQSYFGPDADYVAIRDKRIELMNAFIEKEGVEVKPGIHELLKYLKENKIKTSIATSSPLDRALKHLSSVGLDKAFDEITTGYMVEKGKPEPDIYLFAAEKLGLKPENCLVIEDSPSGILAGSRAGCIAVMVPDQDQPDNATKELLYAKVDNLALITDLLEIIKRNEK